MQTNAADPRQLKEAKLTEKDRRKNEVEDLKSLRALPAFRRFYWRYLQECGVFKSSFTGSSETFFNEGRRDIGLRMMADLNESNPAVYASLVTENNKND